MQVFFLLLLSHIAPATGDFHQPQLAAKDGIVAVTFGSNESIYVATSGDDGQTFGTPVKVAEVPGLNLGNHRGPRVAFAGKTLVVTAINGKTVGDLLAWRSVDRGRTWSGPVRVNDVPKASREGLHAMVAMPDGRLFAAWLDLRNLVPGKPGTELYGAYSNDGGQSWSKNIVVYRSPDGTICQCCHPSLTVDSQGVLHVMWRNVMKGNRDLYTASSRDGGTSWDAAAKLGSGTWHLDACPMDGGGMATDANGAITSVWRRESTLFLTDPAGAESRLAEGKNPAIALSGKGVYLTWQSAKGIEALTPESKTPTTLDADGTFPQLLKLPDGHILAAWERKGTLQLHLF